MVSQASSDLRALVHFSSGSEAVSVSLFDPPPQSRPSTLDPRPRSHHLFSSYRSFHSDTPRWLSARNSRTQTSESNTQMWLQHGSDRILQGRRFLSPDQLLCDRCGWRFGELLQVCLPREMDGIGTRTGKLRLILWLWLCLWHSYQPYYTTISTPKIPSS